MPLSKVKNRSLGKEAQVTFYNTSNCFRHCIYLINPLLKIASQKLCLFYNWENGDTSMVMVFFCVWLSLVLFKRGKKQKI